MAISKAVREQVRNMYGERCAYCGDPLGAKFNVDHVDAVHRNSAKGGKMDKPENDHIGNYKPSCWPCNSDKSTYSLEHWRKVIAHKINVLNRDSAPYRHAKKFGLIQETQKPVVFYFETL